MEIRCQVDAGQKNVCGLAENSVRTGTDSISKAWRDVGLAASRWKVEGISMLWDKAPVRREPGRIVGQSRRMADLGAEKQSGRRLGGDESLV